METAFEFTNIMWFMGRRSDCFLIFQEEQEAKLLRQRQRVDSAQPVKEADGAHCDLELLDYRKASRVHIKSTGTAARSYF